MRILLVGNYLPDRQESMLRFGELMARSLRARGHDVELLQPAPYLGKLASAQGKVGKWFGYIDKFLLFPIRLLLAKKNFDVVHVCDHSNAMYIRHLADVPHIVTCHDVLAIRSALDEIPQNTVSSTGKKFQQLILNGLKLSKLIVCVSENTRNELLRVSARPIESVTVVYLSLNHSYSRMDRNDAIARLSALGFDGDQPYFMHVGGSVW